MKEAWGLDSDPGTKLVEVTVNRLRTKLNDGFNTDLIETKRGDGYRLKAE